MSYEMDMTFYNAKPRSVIHTLTDLSKIDNKKFEEFLTENTFYIPSIRSGNNIETIKDYKEKWSEIDAAWMQRAMHIHTVYWKKFNLLGVIGNYEDLPSAKAYAVYFQNNCDQDYDFKEWPKLKFFKDIISKYKTLSESEIIKLGELEDEDDIDNETIEYHRRWLVYRDIFKTLDMNDIIYNREDIKDENITVLTVSPFQSIYEIYNYERIMQAFVCKYLHLKK